MGISKHLTVQCDRRSGPYGSILKRLRMHQDASWVDLSVTQLTHSRALVQFTYRRRCRSQSVSNTSLWSARCWSGLAVSRVPRFVFLCATWKTVRVGGASLLLSACLHSVYFTSFKVLISNYWTFFESIRNHPHPNHSAFRTRFFSQPLVTEQFGWILWVPCQTGLCSETRVKFCYGDDGAMYL